MRGIKASGLLGALVALQLALPALADESFEKGCKVSVRDAEKHLAERPIENVGKMWEPKRENQTPWDHGYLVELLRHCRKFGFAEGPRWEEMVLASREWSHPRNAKLISREKVYESEQEGFGHEQPECECIFALGSYGPRGSDLSGTLEFKPEMISQRPCSAQWRRRALRACPSDVIATLQH